MLNCNYLDFFFPPPKKDIEKNPSNSNSQQQFHASLNSRVTFQIETSEYYQAIIRKETKNRLSCGFFWHPPQHNTHAKPSGFHWILKQLKKVLIVEGFWQNHVTATWWNVGTLLNVSSSNLVTILVKIWASFVIQLHYNVKFWGTP